MLTLYSRKKNFIVNNKGNHSIYLRFSNLNENWNAFDHVSSSSNIPSLNLALINLGKKVSKYSKPSTVLSMVKTYERNGLHSFVEEKKQYFEKYKVSKLLHNF